MDLEGPGRDVQVGRQISIPGKASERSRRVIGWSIADHMRTSLVIDAIEMAVAARGGHVKGVVFHWDRGAQHVSRAVADTCRRHGIRRSMGRVGSSYDNALA